MNLIKIKKLSLFIYRRWLPISVIAGIVFTFAFLWIVPKLQITVAHAPEKIIDKLLDDI